MSAGHTTPGQVMVGGAELVVVPTAARRSMLVQPIALTVIGALPGLVLLDVIADRRSLGVAAAVAATAAPVTMMCAEAARRRRGFFGGGKATMLVLVVGAAAVALSVSAVWPGDAGRSPGPAVIDAIAHGWAAVVTSPVPAPAEPRLLVPLALTVWAAVAGGVYISLRSAARVAPLLPGAAALVLASVAAGAHQASPLTTGLVFVGAAAVVLASRTPRPAAAARSARARRSAVTAVSLTVAVAAIAAAAGPTLAAGRDESPFDPRDHVTPPNIPSDAENPLDLVASRLKQPDDVMFTVRWSGEPVDTRLVALDSFDGSTWNISGTWVRAGSEIPVAHPDLASESVEADVTIEQLPGPWLPSFGDAPDVSGVFALVHPTSSSLAITGGDMAGTSYTVVADNPAFDDLALLTVDAATDAEAQAALVIPGGVPDRLREIAAAAIAPVTSAADPYIQAEAIERYFQSNYELDPKSTPGHSFARLVEAFFNDLVGTSEQFATGFAVVGRLVGLPTRVVVGFTTGTETESGLYTVAAGDVEVWPEVRFEGVGWVPFHPAPAENSAVENGPNELDGAQVQVQVNDPIPAPAVNPSGGGGGTRGDNAGTAISEWGRRLGLIVPSFIVIAVFAVAALVALKRRQTARRRRARDPRQQVLGAWHDVLDRLVETGVTRPYGQTVEEHVANAERVSASLTGLYRPVTRALYGQSPVHADDATQAWRCRDRFVRAMRSEDSLRRRCRRAVDIRPLLHPAGSHPSTQSPLIGVRP